MKLVGAGAPDVAPALETRLPSWVKVVACGGGGVGAARVGVGGVLGDGGVMS